MSTASPTDTMTQGAQRTPDSRTKRIMRWLFALSLASVGIHHFIDSDLYIAIMPPYLPWHLELVLISGVFEVLGGLGLLIPRTRRAAGWGVLALLIAVYPANIHMLVNEVYLPGMPESLTILWLRMPLQFVFAAWALWVSGIWPRGATTRAS